MLRAHKLEQLELRARLGMGKLEVTSLVFSDVNGQPRRPQTVSKASQRALAAERLPLVMFHSLRHTHASMLIKAGIDVLTISRRLGHSKAAITLDVYGHLIAGSGGGDSRGTEMSVKPRPFWQEVAMGLLGCTFFLWPFFIVALAQPHDTLGQALSDGALVLLIAMWLACLLGLVIGRFRT